MIHLYAVTAVAPDPPAIRGIDGAPLLHPECGALHATVTEHPRAPAATAASATAHAEVVAAVADQLPTVPIRFGVDHADTSSLRRALTEAEDRLLTTLDRVGDAVEFVLRSTVPPPQAAPVSIPLDGADDRGRTYLEDRLRAQRTVREAHDRVRRELRSAADPLTGLALATTEHVGRAGPEVCFLVAKARSSRFVEAADHVLRGGDELLLGGPWPPYTFAGDAAAS